MITVIQAAFLGLLQGVSELFPVSSLGHSILFPKLFGWNISLDAPNFLSFIVLTHLATALVLLGFYWKEWFMIIRGVLQRDVLYTKLLTLLIIGTIPAGLLGLIFEHKLRALFSTTWIVSVCLILNGVFLFAIEKYKSTKIVNRKIETLSFVQACKIGVLQSFALIPGFSRSGFSMGGGLIEGLDHSQAVRFSFLLATPIILAASVLEIPKLFHQQDLAQGSISGSSLFVGVVCAAVGAYVAVRFLEKYVQTKNLKPFAYYCIGFGFLALFLLR